MVNPDERLLNAIKEFQSGNETSFDEIYNLTNKYVYYSILKSVKDEEVAKDVLQDTYLEIYRNLSALKSTEAFRGWVGTIAQHKITHYFKRNPVNYVNEDVEEEFANITEKDEDMLPEDAMENRETQRLISEIIDKLPLKQREAIVAFYYNQMSIPEIAGAMEVPENTVKTWLSRGKGKIKEGVIELDRKHGTKLFTIGIGSVLFLVFSEEAAACELPAGSLQFIKAVTTDASMSGESIANVVTKSQKTAGMIGATKIRIVAAVVAGAVVAGGVGAGIGSHFIIKKNQDQIAVAEKQKREEKTKRSGKEKTEELIGKDPVTESVDENLGFELVEVSEEIKNSKITDEIVQIGNVVFPNDFSLTLREVYDMLDADGGVAFERPEAVPSWAYDENTIIPGHDSTKVYLIRPYKGSIEPRLHSVIEELCIVYIRNFSDEDANIMDCTVMGFEAPNTLQALNFFYPGNICAGAYNGVYVEWMDGYKLPVENLYNKRKEEYPDMNAQEAVEYFDQLVANGDRGLASFEFDREQENKDCYQLTINSKSYYVYEDHNRHREVVFWITIDPNKDKLRFFKFGYTHY